tara:strand:- start:25744 stop:27576 length:1833 start_codon:yes stop_codon:yes gene_type:complete
MARLRQQHPQNYVSSGNIHTDFENVIRYINSAELGDKTVGELLAVLFNESGEFQGPIELRVDSVSGLQYRVGVYTGADDGWINLIDITSLRGPSGSNVGTVEGPFFFNRQDILIGTGVGAATVTAGGSGYNSAPTVSFSSPQDSGGTPPTATAVLTGDAVTSITINSAGSGYTQAPTLTIAAPTSGTTATATCSLAAVAATANVISYSFDANTEETVVYKNGVLLAKATTGSVAEYATNSAANTITISTPTPGVAVGDKLTIYSVRAQTVTNFRRQDTLITASTSSVAFVHTSDETLLVWRNGVLQEPGGGADYIASHTTATITFNTQLSTNDKVTVMTVENQAQKTIAGLMFEDEYTNANGFINWSKLNVAENEIPQNKVNALATSLANKANIKSQLTTPTGSATGDLWLDTSQVPNILKFYTGTQWLETSPESSLPTFVASNASQYVRVNGTGTSLEYGDLDLSSVVPKTWRGSVNGVASLDSSAKIPTNQLPDIFATGTISFFNVWEDASVNVSNKTYFVAKIWKQKLRLDGITHKLAAGTCTIQLSVDGATIGSTFSVSTTSASVNMPTTIEIDGTTTGRRLELVVTNTSGANTLEVGIASATLSV